MYIYIKTSCDKGAWKKGIMHHIHKISKDLGVLGWSLGILGNPWGTPPNRSWGVLGVDGGIGADRGGLRPLRDGTLTLQWAH